MVVENSLLNQIIDTCHVEDYFDDEYEMGGNGIISTVREYCDIFFCCTNRSQSKAQLEKLTCFTDLCATCNFDLVGSLADHSLMIDTGCKSYFKTTYCIPKYCDDCRGKDREREFRISAKFNAYVTLEEWNIISSARIRSWACGANAQQRIVSNFTQDIDDEDAEMTGRKCAVAVIVPILFSFKTERQGHCGLTCGRRKARFVKDWVKCVVDDDKPDEVDAPQTKTDGSATEYYTFDDDSDGEVDVGAENIQSYDSALTIMAENILAMQAERDEIMSDISSLDSPRLLSPEDIQIGLAKISASTSSQPTLPRCPIVRYKMTEMAMMRESFNDKSKFFCPTPPLKRLIDEKISPRSLPSDGTPTPAKRKPLVIDNLLIPDREGRIRMPMISTAASSLEEIDGVKTRVKGEKFLLKSPATGAILAVKPVGGNSIVLTESLGAKKIGPAFTLPLVWDPRDPNTIITAINVRTQLNHKLDIKSPAYARFMSGMNAMLNLWFTAENILEANNLFYYEQNKPTNWTDSKFYATIKELNETYQLGMTESMIKPEVIFKQEKAARIIQNEGPGRCVRNLRLIFIIEHIIFEMIAPHMCIKNKDKKIVMDEVCHAFRLNVLAAQTCPEKERCYYNKCIIGIDAMSFDQHCHYSPPKSSKQKKHEFEGTDYKMPENGLLCAEVNILKKIIKIINADEANAWIKMMMIERTSDKTRSFFRFGAKPVGFGKIYLINRNNRKSGDRGTSVLNWIVEFLCTLAAFFAFPADIVADIVRVITIIDSLRFSATVFKTNFRTKKGTVIKSTFQGLFEGDDGLVRLARIISQYLKEIEANYIDLGIKVTLECNNQESNSVVEVVGCHVLVNQYGETFYYPDHGGGAHCPLVTKSLCKSSWTMSDQKLVDVAASSYEARALQFAGKIDFIETYYKTCQKYWESMGGNANRTVLGRAGKYMGAATYNIALPDHIQKKLLLLSTGKNTNSVFTAFNMDVSNQTQVSDIICEFPPGFKITLDKLNNIN